uniref:Sulfatase N-terminal domain-containing protein n=1 Tax=Capitella teleta TaxID=283909 RepID=X1YV82_CAPTE
MGKNWLVVVDAYSKYPCIHASGTASSSPPNIIFILADDLGWDDVSFHGSKQVPTPNLDALAADGIILGNYYVQPLCSPSRGSLLTGKHPVQIGLQHFVITPSEPAGLSLNETLLPEYLNSVGYKSYMVGKWHLGMYAEQYTPVYRGFESHYGYYHGREDYLDHTNEALIGPSEIGLDFWRNGQADRTGFGQYSTELFTAEAERLVAKHDKKHPMFMYFAQQAVHAGNQGSKNRLFAPWKYTSKFYYIQNENRVKLAGMISALDDSVGNLTKALHANGMLNNTIIVFSTDNGAPHQGDKDFTTGSNFPLRGSKDTVWEGGMRGAGFVWSPLLKKSGYVSNHMMQIADWLPTLLEASGYDMNSLPKNLYGVSQWKALSQNSASARDTMLHNFDQLGHDWALRVGDMKLISGKGPTWKNSGWYRPYSVDIDSPPMNKTNENEAPTELFESDVGSILQNIGRGKAGARPLVVGCGPIPHDVMTNCAVDEKPCLFNVTADPCEYHNLADRYPGMVEKLKAKLEDYKKMSIKPINEPSDPAAYPSKHGGVWVPWVKL